MTDEHDPYGEDEDFEPDDELDGEGNPVDEDEEMDEPDQRARVQPEEPWEEGPCSRREADRRADAYFSSRLGFR